MPKLSPGSFGNHSTNCHHKSYAIITRDSPSLETDAPTDILGDKNSFTDVERQVELVLAPEFESSPFSSPPVALG